MPHLRLLLLLLRILSPPLLLILRRLLRRLHLHLRIILILLRHMPHNRRANGALHDLPLFLAGGHVGEEGFGGLAVVEGAVGGVAGVDVGEDGFHF